jgi:hypothetical protein
VVVDVIIERSHPGKKGATKLIADYDLGGGVIKWGSINIRSIKAKEFKMWWSKLRGKTFKMFKMQWVAFKHLRSNTNPSNKMPLIQKTQYLTQQWVILVYKMCNWKCIMMMIQLMKFDLLIVIIKSGFKMMVPS